jgi:hypothetical protein
MMDQIRATVRIHRLYYFQAQWITLDDGTDDWPDP